MTFKKFLNELTEEEMREELQTLHRRFANVREYYRVELSDDPGAVLKTYQAKLHKTFFPKRGRGRRGRSQSRKVIKEFTAVSDRKRDLTELLFYRAELMGDYIMAYRLDNEGFLTSTAAAFTDACQLAREQQLLDEFRPGVRQLIERFEGNRHARRVRWSAIAREHFGDL